MNNLQALYCRPIDSDSSSSDDSEGEEEERAQDAKGAYIAEKSNFDLSKLSLLKCDEDTYTLTYNNDSRFFLKSGQYMGDIITYEAKFSSSILTKKGDVVEAVRVQAEKLLGKKCTLKFYGKNESVCAAFFPEVVRNNDSQRCLNVLEDGTPELIPLSDLSSKSGCFTVILKSGKIVKTKGKEFTWRMTVVEGELKPLPDQYVGYSRKLDAARVHFFKN